jgi:hypothetical protein
MGNSGAPTNTTTGGGLAPTASSNNGGVNGPICGFDPNGAFVPGGATPVKLAPVNVKTTHLPGWNDPTRALSYYYIYGDDKQAWGDLVTWGFSLPGVGVGGMGMATERAIVGNTGEGISLIERYLGGSGKIIRNADGDYIIMRGNKKLRFDINNPQGDNPHFHIEEQTPSGKWQDAGDQHRYYFKNKQP